MDSGHALQMFIVIGLLGLSAFFSSAETALMAVNKIRVRTLADAGLSRAKILVKVLDNQPKMLSAILIGNNIVNISASSLMTILVTEMFGSTYIGVGTGVLTLLVLLFGEITPKTTATLYSESMALKFAKPIYLLMQVLTPVIFIVDKLSLVVLLLLRIDPNKKQEAITEEELRTIVEVSHEEGVIESDEKKMIYNVFDFGDAVARDIMIPRIDMAFIDVNSTYEEVLKIFRKEKYTRYPVFEDTTDHVIGIVNIKDLILLETEKDFCLRDHLREPMYTYEFKKTAELMMELRKTMNTIAIVLDEYGATAGLITMEDMLEEIVGEIRDEYDEDEEELVKKLNSNEFVIEGAMKLDDLNEQLGLCLESEDYDSIGGFVIGLLEHLPEEGEEVVYENLRLVVEKMERNRIETIHIYLLDEDKTEKHLEETLVEE